MADLSTWMTTAVASVLLAAISMPSVDFDRSRANRRACYALQRGIDQALDQHWAAGHGDVEQLGLDVLKGLVDDGCLDSWPCDPGLGMASAEHYRLAPRGQLYCVVHGFAAPPEGTVGGPAREQLLAAGVTDPATLALTWPTGTLARWSPCDKFPHQTFLAMSATVIFAPLLLLVELLAWFFKRDVPAKERG